MNAASAISCLSRPHNIYDIYDNCPNTAKFLRETGMTMRQLLQLARGEMNTGGLDDVDVATTEAQAAAAAAVDLLRGGYVRHDELVKLQPAWRGCLQLQLQRQLQLQPTTSLCRPAVRLLVACCLRFGAVMSR
jgi:hypothetical protein